MLSAHPLAVMAFAAHLAGVFVLLRTVWSIKFYGPHRLRDALLLNVDEDEEKKQQLYRGVAIASGLFLLGVVLYLADDWLAP